MHVSHNAGCSDNHLPVQRDTPWLDWALERKRDGTPLILESRMHRHESLWPEQLEYLQ